MIGIRGTIAAGRRQTVASELERGNVEDKRIDSFDDLFEPFDLDDSPPPQDEEVAPPVVQQVPTIACPSCGTHNPNYNRHCESCGARLTKGPLPVAPAPMVRATPGSRALGVLAAVVLLVALVAFVFNIINRDDGGSAAVPETTVSSSTPVTAVPTITRLQPTEVVGSSELANFEAANLIDADPETYWNDQSLRGSGAELTFRFARPVQITEIEVQNLTSLEKFTRNYRVQGYQIILDDLPTPVSGVLDDVQNPAPIRIASLQTLELTFKVTSVYPATAFEGQVPFNELAIQEFRFFGQEK